MMKMAKEIAKKVREERDRDERKWEERQRSLSKRREAAGTGRSEDGITDAPPAYAF
jgi:hypothetical protein